MDCKFTNHLPSLRLTIIWVFNMAKYGYFLAIPINPAEMNRIFRDCKADEERINAVINHVVPVIREIWEKTRKLPIIQAEISQENSKKHASQKKR